MDDPKETQQAEETYSTADNVKLPLSKPAPAETPTALSDDALDEVVGGNFSTKNFKSPFD